MVKFLDLQAVTAKYADEIHTAVNRVIDSGWYLQGAENQHFEQNYVFLRYKLRILLFLCQTLKKWIIISIK